MADAITNADLLAAANLMREVREDVCSRINDYLRSVGHKPIPDSLLRDGFTIVVAPDVAARYANEAGPLPNSVIVAKDCEPGTILLVSRKL